MNRWRLKGETMVTLVTKFTIVKEVTMKIIFGTLLSIQNQENPITKNDICRWRLNQETMVTIVIHLPK